MFLIVDRWFNEYWLKISFCFCWINLFLKSSLLISLLDIFLSWFNLINKMLLDWKIGLLISPGFRFVTTLYICFDKALIFIQPILPLLDEELDTLNFDAVFSNPFLFISSIIFEIFTFVNFLSLFTNWISDKFTSLLLISVFKIFSTSLNI